MAPVVPPIRGGYCVGGVSDAPTTTDLEARGSTWSPLRIGVFRAIWLAVLVSNIGLWMQTVGAQWLLVEQPHASILVALVQTADMLPDVIFGVVGGVLADMFDRRRLLIAVQAFMAVTGVALTVLTFTGQMPPALLLTFTFVLGSGSVISTAGVSVADPGSRPARAGCRCVDPGLDQRQRRSRDRTRDRGRAHRSNRGRSGLRDQRRDLSRVRHRRRRLASAGRAVDAASRAIRLSAPRGWPLRAVLAGHAANAPAHLAVPGARQCVVGAPPPGGDAAPAVGRERLRAASRGARCRRSRRVIPSDPAPGQADRQSPARRAPAWCTRW